MLNTRLVLIINFILFSNSIHANLAQVIKLKGNATYISNGMHDAKQVALNQWLNKDTSILTSDKSFIIIKYKTGSEVTLGPNSKIIIDSGSREDQQVVNLLLGKLKSIVKNKAQTDDNKMIIKTKNAAMGVRGTEFQAGYNPESKITTLLTFHGAVAMTKLNTITPTTKEDIKAIENNLSKNSVMVKLGEYSGINETETKIIPPVKISAEQFTKLKISETLGATNEPIDDGKLKAELAKTNIEYANNKTAENNIVRSGGFVDNETGIYLPPPKASEFDKELNIYKTTEKMGTVDNVGNYIPPQGVKIDPTKGLIVDEKKATEEAKNLVKELTESVKKQVEKTDTKKEEIIKKKNNLENKEEDLYKKYYEPTNI